MTSGAEDILLGLGLPGVVIIALLAVVTVLWRRLMTVQDREMHGVREHAREVADVARESTRAIDAVARGTAENARSIESLSRQLERRDG